jgi:hypothetical protein
MDPSSLLPYPVIAVGALCFPLTFGTVFALTQAGMPAKWSYLAAIGIGAAFGGLLGVAFFGFSQYAGLSVIASLVSGLGSQTASRRPAEQIVVEGAAKLGETQLPSVVISQPSVTVIPPINPPDVPKS